jgi:pyruvate dehydrogenase E2 component (dihydrolipoamide acetyltransferase)
MPTSHSIVFLLIASLTPALTAQAPAGAPPAQSSSAPAQAAPAQTAPAKTALTPMLQPSLDALQQTMQGLKLDKWKGGSVRSEAERNISSILGDVQNTLPSLLKTADGSPGSVSQMLPVSRNVDALYDVVLRVFDGARVAAPSDQAAQIQAAMSGLESARRSLNDSLQAAATVQEKLVGDLRVTLKAQATPVCPVQPAPVSNCPATPAKKVVKRKPKPASKPPANPSGSSTANPAPAPATKPNS